MPTVLVGILYLPYQLLLFQTNERAHPAFIAQELVSKNNCIFGRATLLGTQTKDFKPLQYVKLMPDVVIVGSSRSMQFKSKYFNKPSFTFGGAVHNIDQYSSVISNILETHKPKAIILQIDYWWFNPKYLIGVEEKRQHIYKRFRDSIKLSFEPYIWVFEGKLSLSQLIDAAIGLRSPENCQIGLMGRLQHKGYMRDGSYFYGIEYTEFRKDRGFSSAIKAIDYGTFQSGGEPNKISERRLEILIKTLATLDQNDVDYIIVFPPLAPTVYKHIEKKTT